MRNEIEKNLAVAQPAKMAKNMIDSFTINIVPKLFVLSFNDFMPI